MDPVHGTHFVRLQACTSVTAVSDAVHMPPSTALTLDEGCRWHFHSRQQQHGRRPTSGGGCCRCCCCRCSFSCCEPLCQGCSGGESGVMRPEAESMSCRSYCRCANLASAAAGAATARILPSSADMLLCFVRRFAGRRGQKPDCGRGEATLKCSLRA